MFFTLLCFHFIVQVFSEAPPAPPQNVQVERWLMTWSAAPPEQTDVSFTVQYGSFDNPRNEVWRDVPACVGISSTKCNVTLAAAVDENGCMRLRVRANRRGLKSEAVQACSQHGNSCTPDVRLSARPGSLTVHLMGNHSLALEHADHAKHRVFFGRKGEALKPYADKVSSVSIPGLQGSQQYCVMVQYTLFNMSVGPPSCIHCELIPESKQNLKQTAIILAVVFALVVLILVPIIAYRFMFHCGRIKRWLRNTRYHIPEDFFLEPSPRNHIAMPTSIPEEHCDVVTSITLLQTEESD